MRSLFLLFIRFQIERDHFVPFIISNRGADIKLKNYQIMQSYIQ